jgi:hypothetical protein
LNLTSLSVVKLCRAADFYKVSEPRSQVPRAEYQLRVKHSPSGRSTNVSSQALKRIKRLQLRSAIVGSDPHASFNNLISLEDQHLGHFEAKRAGGLEIDDKPQAGRSLDGKLTW